MGLTLHAASCNGELLPWVEADAGTKARARQFRRKWPTVAMEAPEHPFNGGPDLLYSVLPGAALETGLEGGRLQWAVAWLPSDAEGPIPAAPSVGLGGEHARGDHAHGARLVPEIRAWREAIAGLYPVNRQKQKTVPLHERWVEALLTPDLELGGETPELIALQEQTKAWRDAVFTRPPIEGYPAPAVSLPPEGEDFWAGRELPPGFVGPVEAPPAPADVLRRVGELPGWRAERILRDFLAPVYEAASRYALEYVFGRKP